MAARSGEHLKFITGPTLDRRMSVRAKDSGDRRFCAN